MLEAPLHRRHQRTAAENTQWTAYRHGRKQASRAKRPPPWEIPMVVAAPSPPPPPVVAKASPTSTSGTTRARTEPGYASRPCNWMCYHPNHDHSGKQNYESDYSCFGNCGTKAPWVR